MKLFTESRAITLPGGRAGGRAATFLGTLLILHFTPRILTGGQNSTTIATQNSLNRSIGENLSPIEQDTVSKKFQT